MSDDDVRALRREALTKASAVGVALADEALARGAEIARLKDEVDDFTADTKELRAELSRVNADLRERVAQLERELAHFKAPDALPDQTWQEVLDRALEHVAQLETALRDAVAMLVYYTGDTGTYGRTGEVIRAANAALAVGKP